MKKILLSFCSVYALAGVVDPNFSYQDYLDFGNNKGKFKVGEKNIKISSKDGFKDIVFNAPMIDFSAANESGLLINAVTNIGGSYAVSAAHMIEPKDRPDLIVKGRELEFGLIKSKVIASDTDFTAYSSGAEIRDFAIIRMDKLNINSSANLMNMNFYSKNAGSTQYEIYLDSGEKNKLRNSSRYTYFVKSGSGIQGIGKFDESVTPDNIEHSYVFNTGGLLYLNDNDSIGKISFGSSMPGKKRDAFSNSMSPGDSGSALYVFDKVLQKWFLIGVGSTSNCAPNGNIISSSHACSESNYQLINNYIINDFKAAHTQAINDINLTLENNSLKNTNAIYVKPLDSKDDKDLVFNNKTKISLNQNTDLNSSVLYFKNGGEVSGNNNLNIGGVVVLNGELNYEPTTNTSLHKMGAGTLNVLNSSSGALRFGEGVVSLKNIDGNNAFSSIYLLNQAKLVLNYANQINDNVIFGKGGGVLDLNATVATFNNIKALDYNTKIINSSATKSELNINSNSIYHGQIGKNIDVNTNAKVIFDGSFDIDTLNVNGGAVLQAHPTSHEVATYYAISNAEALGEVVSKAPSSENELEKRIFKANKINVANSSLDILSDTSLNVKEINLTSSSLNIGENKIYLDNNDMANLDSSLVFRQSISEKVINPKDIYVNANVFLDNNSTLNIKNQANFKGNISGGTANFDNANIHSNINVENLNANNTNFILDLNTQTIVSNVSTSGADNKISLNTNVKNISNKILLASLAGNVSEDFFTFNDIKNGLLTYKPNIDYENGKWYLSSLSGDNGYFFQEENTEATKSANATLNQMFFSYVLEWNNLQKRMGDLRQNPYEYGTWARLYTGKSAYKDINKTTFYELQAGFDKKVEFNNYDLFTGFLLNHSNYSYSKENATTSYVDGKLKGFGAGVYASALFNDGFYIDAILKYIHYKNDINLNIEGINAKSNDNSYSIVGSVEFGKRFDFENFYLEPQIELISGYIPSLKITSENMILKSSSFIPLHLKTAIFGGFSYEKTNFRAGFGMANDIVKNSKKYLSQDNIQNVYSGERDNRVFVNLGLDYKISDNQRLSFELEKTFFGKFDVDYSANIVYRYSF